MMKVIAKARGQAVAVLNRVYDCRHSAQGGRI